MMRHYLLTRSAFGPKVSIRENRRRVELLREVTVRAVAAQDEKSFAWVVMVDPEDPLLEERTSALRSAGLRYLAIRHAPPEMIVRGGPDRPWGPWADHIRWDQSTLTTRMDDDDAIAPWFMSAVRARAEEWALGFERRTVWSMPAGWRVMGPIVEQVLYKVPMFCTLQAPRGDRTTIYDVGHLSAAKLAPLQVVTDRPAWMWVRHDMTRSHTNMRREMSLAGRDLEPIPPLAYETFPNVDWDLIRSLPQRGQIIPDKERHAGH